MIDKWPFDEIYCIHCVEYKDRYTSSKKVFEKLGILDKVTYWYTCKRPISNFCGNKLLTLHSQYYDMVRGWNPNVYGGVFNCALEHYTVIKTAYLRGLEHILIFEDDIYSNIEQDEWEKILTYLPEDYDFISFNNDAHHDGKSTDKHIEEKGSPFQKHSIKYAPFMNSTCCYALSKNGMKFYIDFNDRIFSYSDKFWMHINKSKYNLYEISPKIFQSHSNQSIIVG